MSYHQTIYDLLRGYGLSEAGALGLIGNWECESNCEPYRVQGDFQSSRAISKAYVAAIENRQKTREQFASDQKGFGLAMWTHPARKANLYDAWLKSPHSIGSVDLQVDFAMTELRTEYAGLLEFLKTAESIYDCCAKVCTQYERPAINNIDARYQAALRIRQELDLTGSAAPEQPAPEPEPDDGQNTAPGWATMPAWRPGLLEYGDKGAEVRLLQDLLICHDFYCTPDGIFGKETERKLKAFQQQAGLEPDGSAGPATWDALKW